MINVSLIVLLWVCGAVFSIGIKCVRTGEITLSWAFIVVVYSWLGALLQLLWWVLSLFNDPVIWRRDDR
jgi:hypothetical protein